MPKQKVLSLNKELQAYIIGLALGDGNLSDINGRTTRLRITCDKKYPLLLLKIFTSIHNLLPENRVGIVQREGCADIYVYSNHLEPLLGWVATKGSKLHQKVHVPTWIKENRAYTISCLRGLIQTDGTIYCDRGYLMVMFANAGEQLSQDAYEMMNSLGFKPHIYKIERPVNTTYHNHQPIYHVRLSKKTEAFLDLVEPYKI